MRNKNSGLLILQKETLTISSIKEMVTNYLDDIPKSNISSKLSDFILLCINLFENQNLKIEHDMIILQGDDIDMGKLLDKFFEIFKITIHFPSIILEHGQISFNKNTLTFVISGNSIQGFHSKDDIIVLKNIDIKNLSISFKEPRESITYELCGELSFQDAKLPNIEFNATGEKGLIVSVELKDFDFSLFAKSCIPSEFEWPKQFSKLYGDTTIVCNFKNNTFQVNCDSKENIDIFSVTTLTINHISVLSDFSMKNLSFDITGKFSIGNYKKDININWQVLLGLDIVFKQDFDEFNFNEFAIDYFKAPFILPKGFDFHTKSGTVEFNFTKDIISMSFHKLLLHIDMGRYFSIDIKSLLVQSNQGDFNLAVSGQISLLKVLKFKGILNLSKFKNNLKISYKNDKQLNFNLPISLLLPNIGLSNSYLEIKANDFNYKYTNESWFAKAQISIGIKGFPKSVEKLFGNSKEFTLTSNDKDLILSLKNKLSTTIDCGSIAVLPTLKQSKLGDLQLSIENFAFRYSYSKSVSVDVDINLILPKNINLIFGVNPSNDKELVNIFETKKPITVSISNTVDSLLVRLKTSPFNGIDITSDKSFTINLGSLGSYEISLDDIVYKPNNNSSFELTGILNVLKQPTGIPTDIVTKYIPMSDNVMPKEIPIKAISLSNGKFGIPEIDSVLKPLMNILNNDTKKLPDAFQTYLDIQLPNKYAYKLTISTELDFSLEIDFVQEENKTLRMLYPSMVVSDLGSQPGLVGFQLNKISLGEVMKGALTILNIDGHFDFFDIPSLILAPSSDIFPEMKKIHSKLTLDNVLFANPYTMPFPLFYDELAFSYQGLFGFDLESHFSFPAPDTGLIALCETLSVFYKYFTDKDYMMKTADIPEKLIMSIGDNYIQLPKILSGTIIGYQGRYDIDVKEIIIHMLNWLKTLALKELIAIIPEKYRKINIDSANLGGLKVSTLTGLIDSDIENRLSGELVGGFDVANFANISASPSFSASLSKGFCSNFAINGGLKELLEIEANGKYEIIPKAPFTSIGGSLYLDFLDTKLAKTAFELESGKISFSVDMDTQKIITLIENQAIGRIKSAIDFKSIVSAIKNNVVKREAFIVKNGVYKTAESANKIASDAYDAAKYSLAEAKKAWKWGKTISAHACDIIIFDSIKKACNKVLDRIDAAKKVVTSNKKILDKKSTELFTALKNKIYAKKAFDNTSRELTKFSKGLVDTIGNLTDLILTIDQAKIDFDCIISNKEFSIHYRFKIKILNLDIPISGKLNIDNPLQCIIQNIITQAIKVLKKL